jgi:hypothetical protein
MFKMFGNKGRGKPKTVEREFSHVVEIAVPPSGLGKRLDAMHAFHSARHFKACLGRGRREGRDHLRWYFSDSTMAADFAAKFRGRRA